MNRDDIDEQWRRQAACKGLAAVMDPPDPTDEQTERALAVCRTCPVLGDCAAWVTTLDGHDDPGGVCGGMTAGQRTGQRRANTLRRCTKCGEIKPLDDYYEFNGQPRSSCKACENDARVEAQRAQRAEQRRLAAMSVPELLTETIATIDAAMQRGRKAS